MSKKKGYMVRKKINAVILFPLVILWFFVVQILPFKAQIWLGERLGRLVLLLSGSRVKIASKNIDVCFPGFSKGEKARLLETSTISLGKGIVETGMAWFWPNNRLRKLCRVEGMEHLEAAKEGGQGVLLFAIHFTPIEICAACLNTHISIDGFYREHKNPLYEYIQRKGRTRRNKQSQVIPKRDTRGMIRALKNGRIVNYAIDQDFGSHRSIFVPFFGVQAATVTSPLTFARLGNARIVPYTTKRRDDAGGYEIKIYPEFTIDPNQDQFAVLSALNNFIEERIRDNPEQYLWFHRRFKTRPEGEASLYD